MKRFRVVSLRKEEDQGTCGCWSMMAQIRTMQKAGQIRPNEALDLIDRWAEHHNGGHHGK